VPLHFQKTLEQPKNGEKYAKEDELAWKEECQALAKIKKSKEGKMKELMEGSTRSQQDEESESIWSLTTKGNPIWWTGLPNHINVPLGTRACRIDRRFKSDAQYSAIAYRIDWRQSPLSNSVPAGER